MCVVRVSRALIVGTCTRGDAIDTLTLVIYVVCLKAQCTSMAASQRNVPLSDPRPTTEECSDLNEIFGELVGWKDRTINTKYEIMHRTLLITPCQENITSPMYYFCYTTLTRKQLLTLSVWIEWLVCLHV